MIGPEGHALFRRLLGQRGPFVLTTHINPDGDAIGSMIGLARFLRSRGAAVRMIAQDAAPPNLKFLENADLASEAYEPAQHDAPLAATERVILLDNSAPDRLGRMEQPLLGVASKTLCIDHHPTRGTPWAENILDRSACATAAMVHELLAEVGWQPDLPAARALYVGIATDTGFFRFNSTNAQGHAIAAQLLQLGVEPARCYQEIYERNSVAYTRLLGRALADLRTTDDGSVVAVRITHAMIDSCGARGVDTSEMTTPLLALDGVWIALLFRELPGRRVKVSLRSKGDTDVHQLALEFGGGGHRNASGIVTDGKLDDVMQEVMRRAAALVAARRGE